MIVRKLVVLTALLAICAVSAYAQPNAGIDKDALIEHMLLVDSLQRSRIDDVILEAVYLEGKMGKEGFEEKERFEKTIYMRYLPDTTLFREVYTAYYKDDELQSEKELEKKARERLEKKRDRRSMDISYPMLTPFHEDHRELYEITYEGVSDEPVNGYVVHQFTVTPKEAADTLIDATYYVEAESFQVVRVDFSPSKLVKKLMFKLNELNMSLTYEPTIEGYWLPREFEIEGKGKAAFLIGVSFAGREYYRNPVVNSPIADSLFEVSDYD